MKNNLVKLLRERMEHFKHSNLYLAYDDILNLIELDPEYYLKYQINKNVKK